MRKIKLLFLSMISIFTMVVFTQCEKDHTGTLNVSCYYLTEDNDTIGPIEGVWVQADTTRISPNFTVDTIISVNGDTIPISRTNYCNEAIRNAHGYTDANGTITFKFPQPLLLTLNASDTITDEMGNITLIYRGKSEVMVKDGAEVDCPIYLNSYAK